MKFLGWLVFSYIAYLVIRNLNLSIDALKLYIKNNSEMLDK